MSIQNYSKQVREKNVKTKIEGFPFEVKEIYTDSIETDKILEVETELYSVFKTYEKYPL